MNAVDDSGQEPGQHTPPTIEAGCEIEIDRSVPGTVDSTGFAQLRARLTTEKDVVRDLAISADAEGLVELAARRWQRYWAFDEVLEWADAIEAHAKDAST